MGARGFSFTGVRLNAVATARPGQAELVRQLMETAKKVNEEPVAQAS